MKTITIMLLSGSIFILAIFGDEIGSKPSVSRAQSRMEKEGVIGEKSYDEIFRKIKRLATALKQYKKKYKKLPVWTKKLAPEFIDEPDLWLNTKPSRSRIFLTGREIPDPDSIGNPMVAFSTAATVSSNHGRFIIDTNFDVWFLGEIKFQNWLAGKKTFDDAKRDKSERPEFLLPDE